MGFYGMYLDPTYMVIFVVTLIISLGAQMYVKSAYGKWSKVPNSNNLTGLQVGQILLQRTGLGVTYQAAYGKGVQFQGIGGQLTDHYDPSKHVVGLSQGVATQASVASMAIVAHELGHAQQHAQHSPLIAMRNFLVPAVRFSPMLSYALIFMGLIFNITGLFYLGILVFGLMVLFSIITLPVEIDASRRGIKLLNEAGLMVNTSDAQGSKNVLTAAATTYIAAAITAVLQLLYYLSIANRRR
ncbi:MAG: zinc metallopeptidase [Anaerolineae bacterium]|nr:zinc metallopeptidase [Anaerolineae bacterium]MCB0249890.1 zinc metallopeptidase [Anaerolineae bacterium]MCB9130177.1 zinc metallopeptidase [Anaerolineales bacterium]MCO5243022.1 zinc metallopeptidase [Anaerolineae bacterium]HRX04371.1 zinc metallopeptidase [Anaerolineae bacterium]